MSSVARINMVLIASKGLLPNNIMEKCFRDCLTELNFKLTNETLMLNDTALGKVLFSDRIVVQTTQSNISILEKTKDLRALFTRRSAVLYQDYQNELEDKILNARKRIANTNELAKFVNSLKQQKEQSVIALERQQKDNCIAIKEELIQEAENQGYDVIDNSTDEIKLQFVKRTY